MLFLEIASRFAVPKKGEEYEARGTWGSKRGEVGELPKYGK
jgi:hypothetical protein